MGTLSGKPIGGLLFFQLLFYWKKIKLISDTNLVLLTGDRVMSVGIAIIYRYISI